jgi:hypothetical protein
MCPNGAGCILMRINVSGAGGNIVAHIRCAMSAGKVRKRFAR